MASLKALAKSLLAGCLRLFSKRDAIIFESTPDFADNTFAVFQNLWEQGYAERYDLVWSCSSEKRLPDSYGKIKYIYPMKRNLKARLQNAYYMANAKCMICCNRFLQPWRNGQAAFYLTHGTPMKNVRGYYTMPETIHYCLSAALGVEEMTAYQFRVDREKMFSLGFPRNDVFSQPPEPVREMLETRCKKVIVWYPTFRQHNNGIRAGSGKALPVIHDVQAARELNEWAQKMDVLLVLKPHFAQDLAEIKDLQLTNIRFIDDTFFQEHNTTSYGFVGGCDALITDYSSIYYDYMLLDKPIGLVWEDVEEYRENPGFAVEIEEYGKGGVRIYTLENFKKFLQEIAEDIDSCQKERRVLCDLVNYAKDGKNTQRVADFIICKAKL